MFGYIYKTTDINDKVYIGQHHGEFDVNYLGSGKIISKIIRKRKDLLRVELERGKISMNNHEKLTRVYIRINIE